MVRAKRRDDRRDFHQRADDARARRKPRPLELARHLVAHDVGLLQHLMRQRIVAARRRLIDDDRERRFQRMRQIADMGARALDDFAIGLDQSIGLARERRDLDREFALQPLGPAGADFRKAIRNALERRKAEAHLQRRGQQQRHGERGKGHADGAIETVGLVVDLRRVAGDRDQITAVAAEIDIALDDAQILLLRSLRITLPIFGGGLLSDRQAAAADLSPTASARNALPASWYRAA